MPRLSEETIAQIADANDIVDVIGSYFPLKRAGPAFKALCPFHQERSPSFTVNPQRQIFKCFGCGAGGTVFRFVMDYEHLDFIAAARRLAERAGIRLEEEELSADDQARYTQRQRLLALHAAAAKWFQKQLFRGDDGAPAREYLKGRGIGSEVAKSWQIGFAPSSFDSLLNWASNQGYGRDDLIQSGLVSVKEVDGEGRPLRDARCYDRFRNRVMFPICNDVGEVIAFSGRTLESNPKAAKYVNSPETPLFTKGAVLFGLHKTKRGLIEKKSAIVCEGQLDLITAFEAGVTNAIAPQGTAFTEKQARILKRYVEEVVLCFDADAAGDKAAERSLGSLLAQGLGVRLAAMPPGEDPDSLIRSQGAEAFLQRIQQARDFFDVQLERLATAPDFETARGRAAAVRKLASWVGLVNDTLLREGVMNRIIVRLGVSPREFSKTIEQEKARPSAREEDGSPEPERPIPRFPDKTLEALAHVALHDAPARSWLLKAQWRDLFEAEPDTGLLAKIFAAELDLENNPRSSINGFLTTLSPEEEAAVSEILEQRPLNRPEVVAEHAWNELVRRQFRRHLEYCESQLRKPGVTLVESLRLLEEMKETKNSLTNIGTS